MIKRRLSVNYVSDLPKDAIKIKKTPGLLKVDVSYQVQEPLFGNIDLLVTFNDHIELIAH